MNKVEISLWEAKEGIRAPGPVCNVDALVWEAVSVGLARATWDQGRLVWVVSVVGLLTGAYTIWIGRCQVL